MRGLSKDFTEQERIAGARAVADELKRHGDQWRLSEEIESPVTRSHSGPAFGKRRDGWANCEAFRLTTSCAFGRRDPPRPS